MHPRVHPQDHHLAAFIPPPALGEINPWDLANLDYSHRVACHSLRSFLYYFCSHKTHHAIVRNRGRVDSLGYVVFELKGPVADDAGRLWLRYVALSNEAKVALTEQERQEFSNRIKKTVNLPLPIIKYLELPTPRQ